MNIYLSSARGYLRIFDIFIFQDWRGEKSFCQCYQRIKEVEQVFQFISVARKKPTKAEISILQSYQNSQ